jgi:MATE family multidrug resistance protein
MAEASSTTRGPVRALLAISWPLIATYSLQAVVGVTDTWFAGRISADALAGLGAQTFLNLAVFVGLGGVAFAVQVPVAQAAGAGQAQVARAYLPAGLLAAALTLPCFLGLTWAGPWLFALWQLPAESTAQAVQYWQPRMAGGVSVVLLFAVSSYLAGLGRTRASLGANLAVAVANVPLNQWLIFDAGLGLAGSAHASTLANLVGVAVGLGMVPRAGWKSSLGSLRARTVELWRIGLPIGVAAAADVLAMALFQLMMSHIGPAEGAATLLLLSLTGLAFWPALGLATGSATLVGHAMGAGQRHQIAAVVHASLWLMAGWMALVGAAMVLAGPPLLAALLGSEAGAGGQAALALATSLLGLVAACQVLDAINLGSAFALRGLGDVRWASTVNTVCSLLLFVPLAAWLSLDALGAGVPALGWGAWGGWLAAALLSAVLAAAFHARLKWVLRGFQETASPGRRPA